MTKPPRVVIHILEDGRQRVYSDASIRCIVVDEACPRDRVYQRGDVIVDPAAIDALIGDSRIGRLGDMPVTEATVRAWLDGEAAPTAPELRVIGQNEHCFTCRHYRRLENIGLSGCHSPTSPEFNRPVRLDGWCGDWAAMGEASTLTIRSDKPMGNAMLQVARGAWRLRPAIATPRIKARVRCMVEAGYLRFEQASPDGIELYAVIGGDHEYERGTAAFLQVQARERT